MNSIALDCPHCHTKKAGFTFVTHTLIEEFTFQTPSRVAGKKSSVFNTFWTCNTCKKGIVIVAKPKRPSSDDPFQLNQLFDDIFDRESTHPKYEASTAPDDTPENIATRFIQGDENLRQRMFEPAAIMFRKALELSAKSLLDMKGNQNLREMIGKLTAERNVIDSMKDWATRIKAFGNDAAHEEDPITEDEAQAARDFAEAFLIYCYKLPAMVARWKAFNQPSAASPSSADPEAPGP
jgi:hypothetical protein